jgi:hypothetical protein
MDQLERRAFTVTELRVDPPPAGSGATGPGTMRGYAAVFNVLSEDLGGFRELVEPGCFTESLGVDDIRALVNHDSSLVLGRNKAGTLRLREDARGLATECELPDTNAGRDIAESIKRGDVTQMSFGFRTIEDVWERHEDGGELRRLRKAQLRDVSPATFPAYPQTDLAVAVRSLEAHREQQRTAGSATPLLDRARREQQLAR